MAVQGAEQSSQEINAKMQSPGKFRSQRIEISLLPCILEQKQVNSWDSSPEHISKVFTCIEYVERGLEEIKLLGKEILGYLEICML